LPIDFIDKLMMSRKVSIVELRVPFVITGTEDNSLNKKQFNLKISSLVLMGKP